MLLEVRMKLSHCLELVIALFLADSLRGFSINLKMEDNSKGKVAFCSDDYPSSGLLYLRFLLLRQRLHLPEKPLDPRTQPPKQVLQDRGGFGLSPPAAAAAVLQKGGRVAAALEEGGLLAFEKSGKYSSIVKLPFELWEGEMSGKTAPGAAFFDWGLVMSVIGRPVPPYMSPPNPEEATLRPSLTWISETFQQAEFVGKKQEELGAHQSPYIMKYTPVLDRFGYPLSPLALANAALPRTDGFPSSRSGSDHTDRNFLHGSGGGSSSSICGKPNMALKGRGVLGAWGPNLAADAIVIREHPQTKRRQVALIQRSDGSNSFALPGGFVDDDELDNLPRAAAREFIEEAVAFAFAQPAGESLAAAGEAAAAKAQAQADSLAVLRQLFGDFNGVGEEQVEFDASSAGQTPICVYAGFVDDERNTENAWMESAAFLWILNEEQSKKIMLEAASDAAQGSAAFYDIEDDPRLAKLGVDPLKDLYGSHSMLLRLALKHI